MDEIKKTINNLPISEEEKTALLKEISGEKDPKKAAAKVSDALAKLEQNLDEEDKKLDVGLAEADKEFNEETKQAEDDFEKEISELEAEAKNTDDDLTKKIDAIRADDVRAELA